MAAFLDNCKFTPSAGGTTDWTYSAAVTGYQSPAAAGVVNGTKYKYFAVSADLTQWEIGEGAYNTSSGVLPRTTVLYNSSGTGAATGQSGAGSKINFTLVPNVAIVGVKEDLLAFDEASSFTSTQQNRAQRNLAVPALLSGYISGLSLSAAGSSTTFSIATGGAADSTSADMMALASALSKTTSAWSAGSGNGALDTGTIAASSWYHVFLIKNVSAQSVDVLVSLSLSSPTLPSGYTLFRRIGSMKTDTSSNWLGFNQVGNIFYWKASIQDRNAAISNLTETTITLSVPTGVRVVPLFRVSLVNGFDVAGLRWRTPDIGPNDTVTNSDFEHAQTGIYTNASSTLRYCGAQDLQVTNTSAQLAFYQNSSSATNTTFVIWTYGWIDNLGGAGFIGAGGSGVASAALAPFMRSYLAGLGLSTAGSSTTFGVAAGVAADGTNADMMTLTASISKTTSAWASGTGSGGLDTGTIAASTWYHAHLIKNPGTQAVDVLVSLSATSPTLPSGFSLFRRIGAMKTDTSSHWILFHQDGDQFLWDAPTQDFSSVNPGASGTRTATVPTGIRMQAIVDIAYQDSGNAGGSATGIILYDPQMGTQSPTSGRATAELVTNGTNQIHAAQQVLVYTNTSAAYAYVTLNANTNNFIYGGTRGWNDTRGRFN